ncbi:MAG: phosphofructokinase [Sulfobacillus benefaciens]|uniref:Tagatose-6-phosphate kinase n=1 Tax=Sulfobacillus benefaciens TaxID=453960 RepID=A0A2T2WL90_9FIRM|nr:MAG: phosphofructokinase [Sulfobacillus benefaciens]
MIYAVTFNPSYDVVFALNSDFRIGGTFNQVPWTGFAGGKGNNVARAIKQLGGEVTAVGFYGGPLGDIILRLLTQTRIPYLNEPAADSSRLCLTLLTDRVTEIRGQGPYVSCDASLTLLRRLQSQIRPTDWITLSGSLPAGLSPNTVTQWIETLRSSCQGIIADLAGENLIAAWEAGVTAICPNQNEYVALSTKPTPSPSQHIIITRGAEGMLWYPPMATTPQKISVPAIPAKNPVGAGDVFVGALAFALSQKSSWKASLTQAIATASASVATPGVAEIDQELFIALQSQVTITPSSVEL